jgi:hypothetical protein
LVCGGDGGGVVQSHNVRLKGVGASQAALKMRG